MFFLNKNNKQDNFSRMNNHGNHDNIANANG